MSDVSQGEGWWLASDGKWYPPETHPQYVAPSGPADPAPSVEPEQPTGSLEFGGWGSLPSDPEPVLTVLPPEPMFAPSAYGPPPVPGQVPPPVLPPVQYPPPADPGYAGSGPVFPPAGPQAGWVPGSPPVPPAVATNGLAIASLVLGILWLGGIGSILAVIFGFVARSQIRTRRQKGSGMAMAGIVLGWIGVGLLLLAILGSATSTTSNSNRSVKFTVIAYTQPCASSLFNQGNTKVITSNSGTRLAAVNLSRGVDGSASLNSGNQVPTCTYTASMVLPGDRSNYTIKVGGTSPLTFSLSEMKADGWNPGITFGCPADLQGGC